MFCRSMKPSPPPPLSASAASAPVVQARAKKAAPKGRGTGNDMAPILAANRCSPGRVAPYLCRLALIWALLPGLTGCAWLDAKQRQVALRPTPGRPADADNPA